MQPERPKRFTRKKIALLVLLIVAVALVWRACAPRRPGISPENLKAIPAVSQGDYQETVAVFGGEKKSVQTSGCGAVCIAMAVGYLTGKDVSPQTLFEWALDEGHYFGDGLSHEALSDMAERYGVKGEWVNNEPEAVLAALEAGYPVIAHMGPGTFTAGGHYILLRGVDDDGRILVNDPGSRERSRESYELPAILSQLRRSRSLMILKP